MDKPTYYEVWVQSPALAFNTSINDVSLHVERFQVASEWSQTVNQWVVAGENIFRVLLHAGPRQHEGLEPGITARCEVREIFALGDSQEVKVLGSAEWTYEEGMSWPQAMEIRTTLNPPFDTRWEWLEADRLGDADLKEASLRLMVEDLNARLSKKDLTGLKKLLEVKARELARAYQIPLEMRLRDQEEFFQEFFSDAQWTMQPIAWDGIIQDLHGQGRLLELLTKDGKPLLASGDLVADGNFRLGLHLFRTKGEWRLAR